jgi:6-phosphofructokinase 1
MNDKKSLNRIGVCTSGGDAPGMNAALRAVTRTALSLGIAVTGINRGYDGMVDDDMFELGQRDVGNIIQRGGSILNTSRSRQFLDPALRKQARCNLKNRGIEAVVVIGGEGSITGANALAETGEINVVAVPATIDRDIPLVGPTIGFDTAINTALHAIDNIRDTAHTVNLMHVVEVMGRNSGWIGLVAGIGGGAEAAVIPEIPTDLKELVGRVRKHLDAGKRGCIVIVAEGGYAGGGRQLAADLKERSGLDLRLTTLGHIQRGGNPSAADRLLGSRLGSAAVEALIEGAGQVVVAEPAGKIELIPFAELAKAFSAPDEALVRLIRLLA